MSFKGMVEKPKHANKPKAIIEFILLSSNKKTFYKS